MYGSIPKPRAFKEHSSIVGASVYTCLCLALSNALHSVYFTVPEEQPINTRIGTLLSQLPPMFRAQSQYLRFLSLNDIESKYFHVNAQTSQLSIRRQLDREALCSNSRRMDERSTNQNESPAYNKSCQVTFRVNILRLNHSGMDIFSMVRVFVTVLDIDDNRCRFLPSDHQHIYVSENQNATQVSLNTLADLDTDSQNNVIKSSLRFITPQSDLVRLLDRFDLLITDTQSAISPYKLDLLILKPLDYEDQNLFELTVKAGGRKQKHSCSLLITVHVLDENDHPPRFSQRLVHLPIQENVSTSQPLFTPVASDNDDGPMYGKLLFEMSPFNSASVRASFYVVPDNGSVFLRKTLNYAERSSYKITLVVRNPERTLSVGLTDYNMDGSTSVAKYLGEQDTMDLIIDVQDVNDNCPKILMYSINGSKTLTLTEHMSVPQADFAVVRVTDEDSGPNGQVTCTLDENSTKTFKLTRIDQVQFSQPSISSKITENYTKSNGAMFKLAALRSFDRETSDQVSFGILCIDHGEPPQRTSTEGVINILDVNDHVPKFETTYVRLEIVEDTDPNRQVKNYFVLQLNASDKDVGENGKISYSLSSEPEEDGLFTIDQDSGIIRTTGKLDRELNSTITLIAMATDSGEPKRSASLKIHLTVLDYNDQTPQFEHSVYEYSVKENVVRGHLIGSVVACDKDYGLNAVLNFYLTYSLHGDEDEQKYRFESEIPFRIMPSYLVTTHCYEAKLFTNSVIDREQLLTESKETGIEKNTQMKNRTSVQVFDLEIVAEDSGTPKRRSKAKINLLVTDENDEHPVFLLPKPDQTAIELSQYEPVHSEFLQVLAVDRDEGPNGTVQYFIRNIVIYDFGQTDVDSYRCNAGWIKYKPITTRMGINLREYFYMNSSTGKLRLARELPSKLVGHVCIITILARDMGPFATLETSLNICVKITDSPSRQINGSIPGYLRRAPQQRTLFYLYIITGVLVSVLTFSITFVLAAYCLWYRGDVSSDKHISNAIHYSEGGLGPEETHRDANDFIYREDGLGATVNLRNWSTSEHSTECLQTIPTNFQPGTPDLSHNPSIGNAKGMTSRNRPDFNGVLVPSVEANSSVYYTLINTHVLNNPLESNNQLH